MNGSNSNTSGSQVATISIKPDPNGKISESVLQEMQRRLVITIETAAQGNVVFSTTPPEDTTKVWWKTDPVSGLPTGQPLTYNSSTSTWEANNPTNSIVLKKRRTGVKFVEEGDSTVNILFTDMGSIGYNVKLTPTTMDADGAFQVPQAADTSSWVVSAQAANQCSVTFYAVPTGGLSYLYEIEETGDIN